NLDTQVHYKFFHAENSYRFVLPTHGRNQFPLMKLRIFAVLGTSDVTLFWADDETLNCLDDVSDLEAAIDYAVITANNTSLSPCIHISFEKSEQVAASTAVQQPAAAVDDETIEEIEEQLGLADRYASGLRKHLNAIYKILDDQVEAIESESNGESKQQMKLALTATISSILRMAKENFAAFFSSDSGRELIAYAKDLLGALMVKGISEPDNADEAAERPAARDDDEEDEIDQESMRSEGSADNLDSEPERDLVRFSTQQYKQYASLVPPILAPPVLTSRIDDMQKKKVATVVSSGLKLLLDQRNALARRCTQLSEHAEIFRQEGAEAQRVSTKQELWRVREQLEVMDVAVERKLEEEDKSLELLANEHVVLAKRCAELREHVDIFDRTGAAWLHEKAEQEMYRVRELLEQKYQAIEEKMARDERMEKERAVKESLANKQEKHHIFEEKLNQTASQTMKNANAVQEHTVDDEESDDDDYDDVSDEEDGETSESEYELLH
ncbi:hypothetical protein PENTCL1PPCAC_5559, partial [Pristionchus entomophagus]